MTPVAGIVGAALLLAGGAAMVVAGLRADSRSGVQRLQEVLGDPRAARNVDASRLGAVWSQLARAADNAGRGTDLFTRWGGRLERAGWLLRPAEFFLLLAGMGVAGALVGAVFVGGLGGALLGAAAGSVAPPLALARRGRQVARAAEAQLPDVLGQIGSSMRAGHSLMQGMEVVADRASPPLGPQFARVLAETRVGRPLEEALEAMASRVGSIDLSWTVRAMAIQARTGGTLSDLLEVLAEFMREREEVRREVKALTAEGRLSAAVLLLLPFLIVAAILFASPDYLRPLFGTGLGLLMLGGAGVLMAFAALWIRKIVKIEV